MKGITAGNIAPVANVSRSAINQTIRGKIKSHRLRKAIAQALEMEIEDLWPETGGRQKCSPM